MHVTDEANVHMYWWAARSTLSSRSGSSLKKQRCSPKLPKRDARLACFTTPKLIRCERLGDSAGTCGAELGRAEEPRAKTYVSLLCFDFCGGWRSTVSGRSVGLCERHSV